MSFFLAAIACAILTQLFVTDHYKDAAERKLRSDQLTASGAIAVVFFLAALMFLAWGVAQEV